MFLKLRNPSESNKITGVSVTGFNPNHPFVGLKKPSGGMIYFNLLGTRIQPTAETLTSEALADVMEGYGSPHSISSGNPDFLANAQAGELVPWKGLTLQKYYQSDNFWFVAHS